MSEKVYYQISTDGQSYITPCPYNKTLDNSLIFVRSVSCQLCPHNVSISNNDRYIKCSYLEYEKTDGKKYDSDKIRLDLVPPEAIEAIGEVMTFGCKKYKENTWQNLEDFEKRYYSALLRHLMAWKRGEKYDTGEGGSGLSHLKHALWNVAVLVWKELQND